MFEIVTASSRAARQTHLRAVPDPPKGPARVEHTLESDQELIDAAARGDSKVAGKLYDRLIGVVNRSLYRIFGRREMSHDDLVQATFEQIIITLGKGRFVGAAGLSAWASTVTWHVALKALRSRRRERRVLSWGEEPTSEPMVAAPHADLEHNLALRREISNARAELAEMDPAKAEAFLLHDVFGHDLSEIAAITNVSVAAAQSRLVRGRKEFYARMQAQRGPSSDSGGRDGKQ
jgi:RNA polymerase sigma-70 factor (ECF subfamily)